MKDAIGLLARAITGGVWVVAGWLKFPFWPCLAYMAVGKFLRYFLMTGSLIWAFPGVIGA